MSCCRPTKRFRKASGLAAAEPGDDRAIAENGIRSGEFAAAGSAAGRATQAAQNRSRSGTDHRADLGAGDRRCFALPVDPQAISYCGLCGEEKSSADKVMRTPLSKQRNKHIQRVLVEAAKLAPRQDHELALVYEREKQKGNANRATLAVARKMVAYLLAVDRGQRDFVPCQIPRARRRKTAAQGKKQQDHTARRLPGLRSAD